MDVHSPDLALDLIPVTEDIDLSHADKKLFTFVVPKTVLTCSVNTSIHFRDLNLNEDRDHINDVVFYCFITLFLSSDNQEFVKKTFSDFYVDVSYHPDYITFIGVLKPDTTSQDGSSLFNTAAHRAVFVNSLLMGLQRNDVADNDGGNASGAGTSTMVAQGLGNNGGSGGGSGGGGGAGKGGKRKRGQTDVAIQKSLRFAADHLGMKAVPTFAISKSAAFLEKLESWGHLISSDTDLARVILEWVARRFKAAGRGALVQRVPHGTDPTADRNELNLECPIRVTEAGNVTQMDGTFWAVVSATCPVYEMLDILRPCFRQTNPSVEAVQGVYRMGYFRVDMSYLLHRFFSEHDIFARFDVFCERVRGTGDEFLANQAGDVECLTRFFDEFSSFRVDKKLASAHLVFDTFSRRGGLLPKSVRNTFVWFHERLKKQNGMLFPVATYASNAVKYCNLSYSANYVLHMTQSFEKLGTFHFHCEQLYMFLISDGVCFRSIGDDDEMRSMVPNLIVYGPPGIGKSTAALLLMSVYKHTMKPFSYASHRSDYGQKPSADYDNNVCMYQDEAPAWLVDVSKLANGDAEKITQKKEQKSSGRMVGERMCQNPATGVWATMSFNGEVFNNPEILNTNAAEKAGDGPLLNRYNQRYFMAGLRARDHALMTGADGPSTEELRAIKHEMQTERSLLLLLSKMQSVGIVPGPDLTVHTDFYRRFLQELRRNPYLDAEPFTSGDRRSGMIEILFNCLVNRIAIRRVFLDNTAEFRNVPFDVKQMLRLSELMLHGDLQASIIAISTFSHVFRSPTEWRVAVLIANKYFRDRFVEEVNEHGERAMTFNVEVDGNGDDMEDTGSEKSEKFGACGVPSDKLDVFVEKYELVESFKLPFRNSPTDADMAKAFANRLRDGSSTAFIMMPEHVAKRTVMLATIMVREGPDKGLPCLAFFYVEGMKEVSAFVLKSWLLECAFNHEHSVKTMLHRAACSNLFTRPGRYVVPAPLLVDDAAPHVAAATLAVTQSKGRYIPHLMSFFDVPLHARTCALYDPAKEAQCMAQNWNFQVTYATGTVGCTCFRSRAAQTGCTHANDRVYALCPENVAESLFTKRHADVRGYLMARGNRLDKGCLQANAGAIGVYPAVGVTEAISASGARTRVVTELTAEQTRVLEARAEWAEQCRRQGKWCEDAADMEDVSERMRTLGRD